MQIASFIIISYNRPGDTAIVVRNILDLDEVVGWQKEIVIINNGSDKSYASFEKMLEELPQSQRALVNYVDNGENLGVARGRNLGVKLAKGNLLIFIDDDAEFSEKNVLSLSLQKLEQYQHKNVKLIAFRELRTFNNEYYIATKSKALLGQREFLTNFFVGSGHVIKREVFDTVGDYITDFFYGMEEYDLAYKALDAGYRILYTADVTVLHKKSMDGRAPEKTMYRWMLENKTVVAYKYLPKFYVFTHLFFWSAYLLLKTRFDVPLLLKAWCNIPAKLKNTQRHPISKATLKHIKNVQGRLIY